MPEACSTGSMDSESDRRARWEKLSRLYHTAVARQGSDREAFLDEACAGDDGLRGELVSLLAHGDSDSLLENAAFDDALNMIREAHFLDGLIGRDVGRYRVTASIGAGGMGVVFKAVDSKFKRPVAIKLLSNAVANASVRRRFVRE